MACPSRVRRRLDVQLVDIAPAPVLATLEAADDGMPCLVKVLRGVSVRRVVTATDVAAAQAESQVDPAAADLETFLAPLGRPRLDVADLAQMRAHFVHDSSSIVRRPPDTRYRSGLNAARSSDARSAGSSQAAKWPPRSTALKYAR